MAKRPSQPTQPEIYCGSNGVMVIRAPNPGGMTWLSVKLNTSNIDQAREGFAKWLAKNKITGINARIAPINSLYGPLTGNGSTSSMMRAAKAAALQGSPPPSQVPAVYDAALAKAAELREYKREKSRRYYHDRKAREKNGAAVAPSANAHSLLAALAANLAAAATMLRMLEEALGAPKSDIQN